MLSPTAFVMFNIMLVFCCNVNNIAVEFYCVNVLLEYWMHTRHDNQIMVWCLTSREELLGICNPPNQIQVPEETDQLFFFCLLSKMPIASVSQYLCLNPESTDYHCTPGSHIDLFDSMRPIDLFDCTMHVNVLNVLLESQYDFIIMLAYYKVKITHLCII